MIRNATVKDAKAISSIYNHFVDNTIVTFDEKPITLTQTEKWILQVSEKYPWIVYEKDKDIVGYAYAGEWKSRCSYKHSVESSVYLKPGNDSQGIGSALYAELLEELRKLEIHVVIGGISLPNERSIALHEKFGFEKVAHFKQVGNKFGKWIDVGYWQLLL